MTEQKVRQGWSDIFWIIFFTEPSYFFKVFFLKFSPRVAAWSIDLHGNRNIELKFQSVFSLLFFVLKVHFDLEVNIACRRWNSQSHSKKSQCKCMWFTVRVHWLTFKSMKSTDPRLRRMKVGILEMKQCSRINIISRRWQCQFRGAKSREKHSRRRGTAVRAN